MKKLINFSVENEHFKFTCRTEQIEDERVFLIPKKDAKFDAKSFYSTFFEGLTERIEIDMPCDDGDLSAADKYIFNSVKDILDAVCKRVNEDCFCFEEKVDIPN